MRLRTATLLSPLIALLAAPAAAQAETAAPAPTAASAQPAAPAQTAPVEADPEVAGAATPPARFASHARIVPASTLPPIPGSTISDTHRAGHGSAG